MLDLMKSNNQSAQKENTFDDASFTDTTDEGGTGKQQKTKAIGTCTGSFGERKCQDCFVCDDNVGIMFDCANIVEGFSSQGRCLRFDLIWNWRKMIQSKLSGALPEIPSLY
jgi:hypothetical protein